MVEILDLAGCSNKEGRPLDIFKRDFAKAKFEALFLSLFDVMETSLASAALLPMYENEAPIHSSSVGDLIFNASKNHHVVHLQPTIILTTAEHKVVSLHHPFSQSPLDTPVALTQKAFFHQLLLFTNLSRLS